jgi:hypothetical protein
MAVRHGKRVIHLDTKDWIGLAQGYHGRACLAVKRLAKLVAGIAPPTAAFFLSCCFFAFGFSVWTVVYPTVLFGFALALPILYSTIPRD